MSIVTKYYQLNREHKSEYILNLIILSSQLLLIINYKTYFIMISIIKRLNNVIKEYKGVLTREVI